MSTIYRLLSKSESGLEVTEHSCKFDILLEKNQEEPNCIEVEDLSLEDLKTLNQNLTNLISYFDDNYVECKIDY